MERDRQHDEQTAQRPELSSVHAALAALTTITVIGSEPISTSTYFAEPELPEKFNYKAQVLEGAKPHQTTSIQYPIVVDEIATTTTLINSVSEIQTLREEIVERHERVKQQQHEEEEVEFVTRPSYEPLEPNVEEEVITRDEPQEDLVQSEDELDRARQEFAGNYSSVLVFNALKQFEMAEQQVFGSNKHLQANNQKVSIRPVYDTDEEEDEYDDDELSGGGGDEADVSFMPQHKPQPTRLDESQFIQKIFTFKKSLNQEKLQLKKQIMESLNRDDLDFDDLNSSLSELSAANGAAPNSEPAFSIGIRLKPKANMLEIGNHVINFVEANSPAEKAGVKVNSQLHKINEVPCGDKTHEFVLFYLNYVLCKANIETIELLVYEPFVLPSPADLTTKAYNPSYSRLQTLNEHFSEEENRYLKSIIRDILSHSNHVVPSSTFSNNNNNKNLKTIVLEASGNRPIKADEKKFEFESSLQSGNSQPSLHSALAALTQITAMGSNESAKDSKLGLINQTREDTFSWSGLMTPTKENKPVVREEHTASSLHSALSALTHITSLGEAKMNESASVKVNTSDSLHSALSALTQITAMGNSVQTQPPNQVSTKIITYHDKKYDNSFSIDNLRDIIREASDHKLSLLVPSLGDKTELVVKDGAKVTLVEAPKIAVLKSNENLRQIINEASGKSHIKLAPTKFEDKYDEQTSSSLHSALAALTKITSLGNEEASQSYHAVPINEIQFQGSYNSISAFHTHTTTHKLIGFIVYLSKLVLTADWGLTQL